MAIFFSVLALIAAIGSIVYSKILNDRNQKELDTLRNKTNRLEADAMYDKVQARRAELEEAVSELMVVERSIAESEESDAEADYTFYETAIVRCMTKYNVLYGELEAFCTHVLDGTINSESYLTADVLTGLKQDAIRQATLFGTINKAAKSLDLSPIPKPDPSSYKNFEAVIQRYCGKDKLWLNSLESIRYENSFEY